MKTHEKRKEKKTQTNKQRWIRLHFQTLLEIQWAVLGEYRP